MDPSWRIKTRPCPFYSQGKCLFADSCNFRHSAVIKATINPEVALLRELRTQSPRTPVGARSPRIDGLLLALGDAIAPAEEEDYEEEDSFEEQVSYEIDKPGPQSGEDSYTLFDDTESSAQISKDLKKLNNEDSPESPPPVAELLAPVVPPEAPSRNHAPPPEAIIVPSTPANSHLLSPVTGTLPRIPFASERAPSRVSVCNPDDEGEDWHSPQPMQLEPPRSPAMSSTFDILASPFRSPSMRIASSQFGSFLSFLQPGAVEASSGSASNDDVTDLDLDSPGPSPNTLAKSNIGEDTLTPATAPRASEDTLTPADVRRLSDAAEDSDTHAATDNAESLISSSEDHTVVPTLRVANYSPDSAEARAVSTPVIDNPQGIGSSFQGIGTTQDVSCDDSFELIAIEDPEDVNSSLQGLYAPEDHSEDHSFTLPDESEEINTSIRALHSAQHLSPDESVNLSPYRNLLGSQNSLPTAPETVDEWEDGLPEDNSFNTDDVTAQLPYLHDPTDDTIHSLYEIYSDISSSPESSSRSPQLLTQEPSQGSETSHPEARVVDDRPPVFSRPQTRPTTPSSSSALQQSTADELSSPPQSPHSMYRNTVHELRLSLHMHRRTQSPPTPMRFDTVEEFSPDMQPREELPPPPGRDIVENSLRVLESPFSLRRETVEEMSPHTLNWANSLRRYTLDQAPSHMQPREEPPRSLRYDAGEEGSSQMQSRADSPPTLDSDQVEQHFPQDSGLYPVEHLPPLLRSSSIPSGFGDTHDASSAFSEPEAKSVRPDSLQIDTQSEKVRNPKPSAGLKPLRLSVIVNSRPPSPPQSSSSSNSNCFDRSANRSALRESPDSSVAASPVSNNFNPPLSAKSFSGQLLRHDEPSTSRRVSLRNSHRLSTTDIRPAPLRRDSSWGIPPSTFSHAHQLSRPSSRTSEPITRIEEEDNDATLIAPGPATAPITRPPSVFSLHPAHPATPRPNLLFAIASDDADQVRAALGNGNASANDQVGPQCALAFTLSNDQIINKLGIVKTLLAYGADPNALDNPELNPPARTSSPSDANPGLPPLSTRFENMDPATRYYVSRAKSEAMHKNRALVQRTEFQPLVRVCFDLIGQDLAFEQLFRALNTRSKQRKPGPVVAFLCGPSGHGKSFVAHRFSSLLDIPSHTVNLTTVRTPGDLWRSLSIDPTDDVESQLTLEEFLIENEGRPCVVVLDEIEKTAKENLFSLLVPFELGRCPIEAGKRHVDVRRVTWLATSNIGQEPIFEFERARTTPEIPISRQEYLQLTTTLRDQVSEQLGASLLSRVTCVLPFVPFSKEELRAIAAESVMTLGGEDASRLDNPTISGIIDRSLQAYVAREGARSLYRAVSNELVDFC